MDALSSAFNWLANTYELVDSWRWLIGALVFWGLLILVFMDGSPKTERLVPRWLKNWLRRVNRTEQD